VGFTVPELTWIKVAMSIERKLGMGLVPGYTVLSQFQGELK
jgi:hypothetical protein